MAVDIDGARTVGGCAWGLTVLDLKGRKPTYAGVQGEGLCPSPLRTEELDHQQTAVVARAQTVVEMKPTAASQSSSKDKHPTYPRQQVPENP